MIKIMSTFQNILLDHVDFVSGLSFVLFYNIYNEFEQSQ